MDYWQERFEATKQKMKALGSIPEENDQPEIKEQEMWNYNDTIPNREGEYP
jgi:hypothetical protein